MKRKITRRIKREKQKQQQKIWEQMKKIIAEAIEFERNIECINENQKGDSYDN